MSNNTASNSAAINSADVPNVAQVVEIARKSNKPREAKKTTEDVSSITLDAAFKAVKETDSALFNFSVSLTAMMLDSLSRKVKRGEAFEPNKDPKKLPSKVTESNNDVLYALQVRCAFKGAQIILDTAAQAKEIGEMKDGRLVERVVDGKTGLFPDADLQAKMTAARNYVSAAYVWREVERDESGNFIMDPVVTKDDAGNNVETFVPRIKQGATGRTLPVSVRKEDLTAGKYPGAKAKALVSSFATARRMSAFLVKWFWDNRRSYINDLGGKDMLAEDVAQVRAIITDTFGGTFAELESAYRSGRPAPSATKSFVERIQESANNNKNLTLEDVTKLAQFFEQLRIQKSRGKDDSEMAAGLVPVMLISGIDSASDDDDAAPLTGTEG